ncbi:hypothetical protein [Aquisphaera insulae]|uniref:hypothetical protein n=1 Tax=Aquisphaera insulae TaxID=2712864 RepID=UPI0013EC0E6A|nr:hypothetical protein [Aquisphaera insulae]
MPRIRLEATPRISAANRGLVARLSDELRIERSFGQPRIYEQTYSTGKTRVLVIWDEWADRSLEERSAIILAAYESAEGTSSRDRIALASGLTMPEATTAGMLPYQVIASRRATDPVTEAEVRAMLIEQGASTLDSGTLRIRFATVKEAEECIERLVEKYPASRPIWSILREDFSTDSETSSELNDLVP